MRVNQSLFNKIVIKKVIKSFIQPAPGILPRSNCPHIKFWRHVHQATKQQYLTFLNLVRKLLERLQKNILSDFEKFSSLASMPRALYFQLICVCTINCTHSTGKCTNSPEIKFELLQHVTIRECNLNIL